MRVRFFFSSVLTASLLLMLSACGQSLQPNPDEPDRVATSVAAMSNTAQAKAPTIQSQAKGTAQAGLANLQTNVIPSIQAVVTTTLVPAAQTTIAQAQTSVAPTAEMVMTTTGQISEPYDVHFIDSMIEHHQSAIAMAQRALKEAQHEELRGLAQQIITAQQQEIEQMRSWRKQWYPNTPATSGLGMNMGQMTIPDNAAIPFDLRFLSTMIDHHQGAIMMAQEAQQEAEHAELRALAQKIITAQQAEITQMNSWAQQWAQ